MSSLTPPERAAPALLDRLRSLPATWACVALGTAAIGIYYLLPSHAQSVLYVLIGLASVGAISVGTIRNLPIADRPAWRLFAAGLLMEVVGDAIYGVYELELNREPPLPSIADVFYLGGYPLLALGIILILRRLGGQTSRAAILDSIVIFCAVLLVQWVFFIEPYRHTTFASESQRITAMAYPLADVLLLVGLAQLVLGPGGRTAAYRLLLASIGLWVVADEIYGLNVNGYQAGSWLDALWLASYVLWAAAALHSSVGRLALPERRQLPRLTAARLTLLAAALLLGPSISLFERLHRGRTHVYVIAPVSAAIGMLVLLRLAGLVRSVERARRSERLARREAEQAQQLLAHQNDQLVELDTLKDEFVSSVSHELRTPLTSISGYVELLIEDEQNEEKRGYLTIVDRNAQRLLGLVSDLLFTARLQDGRLELERSDVDFAEVVRHAVESARPRAETLSIELVLESDDEAVVSGEPARLGQLLDNLVSNAIKFTPQGGRVLVRLTRVAGLARVEVSDTGIGIPGEEREKLFERFFRSQAALERQIQGTGLGLYISKAIVDAHGGRIGVTSREGHGTTFVVELPANA
ncbi:MAG TPA: HAMP domain-containing sensor histidine kinase [Gaiellaceae bacterium]|nr:HAMP domain-containing sensor histidine kinase [Gaiellaceae bacterium]